jgi:hypothetical protein
MHPYNDRLRHDEFRIWKDSNFFARMRTASWDSPLESALSYSHVLIFYTSANVKSGVFANSSFLNMPFAFSKSDLCAFTPREIFQLRILHHRFETRMQKIMSRSDFCPEPDRKYSQHEQSCKEMEWLLKGL